MAMQSPAAAVASPQMARQMARPQETPPLAPGDHLSRAEFERRYAAHPDIKKAELIEGVVFMPSPVRFDRHAAPHLALAAWAGVYLASTPGVHAGDNATVRLDNQNEPQPDLLLRIDAAHGGRSTVAPDDYIEGAPELVVEVAATSANYDMHDKKLVYARNGVPEYLVLLTFERTVHWFVLEDGEYVAQQADAAGVLRSRVFPGLWLDVDALLAQDMAKLLSVLQQGLAAPEHAAFVAKLNPPDEAAIS